MKSKTVNQSGDIAGLPDDALVAMAIDGDVDAFEKIMRRFNQRSFRIARSYMQQDQDAMDVVQDAYMRAFTNLRQYAGPAKFSAWLGQIVRNEAMMKLRKMKRIYYLAHGELEELQRHDADQPENLSVPEQAAQGAQITALIEQSIDHLPTDFREIFMLRGLEQLSIEEVSSITGVRPETVKTRYHRARKLMQANLLKQVDDSERNAFAIAGDRCDTIVRVVRARLKSSGMI